VSDRPVFSFYGDDFTGSTDALEALAESGVETVLFLLTPDDDDLRQFEACRAIGIAGDSRSRSPEWMRSNLPAIFERLRAIGAPIVQYKVCSTFDSSPDAGSIGCALEIGQDVFGVPWVPVIPAAPLLGRYVVFGNLFAAGGGAIHRIDRHPTMKQHPVTPMDEGDMVVHLSRQTARRLGRVNILELRVGATVSGAVDAVLFDGLDRADLARAAALIWDGRHEPQTFVVGSSGFTYGLMDYWRRAGRLPESPRLAAPAHVDRVLVLAGSCSPVTGAQIAHAISNGFCGIRLDARDPDQHAVEREAVAGLAEGRSVILYSAQGPSDRVEIADRHALAAAMGRRLHGVILATGVRRVVVAGGDTASHAVQELGITALTYAAPLARGAPLCRAHGWPGELELVLKGGQVGSERFFEEVLS
jgi:uncharacterized protein YgbK (DUF1537 family)